MQAQRRERSPRIELNMPVRFHAPDMPDFESGELVNLSDTGFLIATPRQLVIGSRIQVAYQGAAAGLAATVVRFDAKLELNTKKGGAWYWYGCRLEKPDQQAA